MLKSARMHAVSCRHLVWLCKRRWVICKSIITLAQYFRPVPLKRLLWLDELPAVIVDTQQRIQVSRGGVELVLLSENELDKQLSSLGEIAWVFFFFPSPSSFIFLASLARLVFGLMGIILCKRPKVMSEAEHLAVFAKSPYFQSFPLGCAPLLLTLPRGVYFSHYWVKRPEGFRGSACKSPAVPTGFQS